MVAVVTGSTASLSSGRCRVRATRLRRARVSAVGGWGSSGRPIVSAPGCHDPCGPHLGGRPLPSSEHAICRTRVDRRDLNAKIRSLVLRPRLVQPHDPEPPDEIRLAVASRELSVPWRLMAGCSPPTPNASSHGLQCRRLSGSVNASGRSTRGGPPVNDPQLLCTGLEALVAFFRLEIADHGIPGHSCQKREKKVTVTERDIDKYPR